MSDAPTDLRRVPWTNLRLRAFRDVHPQGEISTRIIGEEPLTIVAEVFDEARRMLARGTARHTRNDFAVEDVETSAISRALKFAGFIIDDGDLTPREQVADFDAPRMWPAAEIKAGMVHEIATQVTHRDIDQARELALLAWHTFNLDAVTELAEPDALDKVAGAVELAAQEVAADIEAIDAAEHVSPQVKDFTGRVLTHLGIPDPEHEAIDDVLASLPDDKTRASAPEEEPDMAEPPVVPWTSAADMRRDIKARGISTRQVWVEVHRIASVLGEQGPAGSLDAIYRHPDRRLVAKFAAWVRNHDEVEAASS